MCAYHIHQEAELLRVLQRHWTMVHCSSSVYLHNQFHIDIENAKQTHESLLCTESALKRVCLQVLRELDLIMAV